MPLWHYLLICYMAFRLSVSLIVSLSCLANAFSQVYVKSDGNVDVDGDPGSFLLQKKYIPKNEGSKLLFKEFNWGLIYVKGRAQKNNLNIDLDENVVVFAYQDATRQLHFAGIDSVVFDKFKVIFKLAGLQGCLLVYDAGEHKIIDYKTASLKEPNYNRSLDVGNRDNLWVINDTYYLVKRTEDYFDKTLGVEELPSNKKKIAQLFNNSEEVLAFIKGKKLNFKGVEDYVLLFTEFPGSLK